MHSGSIEGSPKAGPHTWSSNAIYIVNPNFPRIGGRRVNARCEKVTDFSITKQPWQ